MTELELLQEINENIKRLLGAISTQGMNDEKKILTLQNMGFNSKQISEMSGIPWSTVKSKWKSNKNKKVK